MSNTNQHAHSTQQNISYKCEKTTHINRLSVDENKFGDNQSAKRCLLYAKYTQRHLIIRILNGMQVAKSVINSA